MTIKEMFPYLNKIENTKLINAISKVHKSVRDSLPISTATATITATAPTLIASKNAEMILDFLILEMIGFRMATSKNEGMNIPNVASIAPQKPFNCQPINVVVDKTNPGVNCPIATASIKICRWGQALLADLAKN